MPPHERLGEQAAGPVGGVERARHFHFPPIQRLLTQDVLARVQRADAPLDVH